jgi:sulfite reductase (ferredoxin)
LKGLPDGCPHGLMKGPMPTQTNPIFPCAELPESPAAARLLGLYPQRQEGLWLQRIKVQGGALAPQQWEALAGCCDRFTPGTPLLLTTRQDIEFHNVLPRDVPLLQQALAEAQLNGLGACGDTLRNITLCPGNGLTSESVDLRALAEAVRQSLMEFSAIYRLPRKFKISFSACPKACGQPWINDLGFVVQRKKGAVVFQVIGAGSLGPRPAAGIVLQEDLALEDAPAFARAALALFNEYGDREHRGKARLRHVRQRLGDEAFLQLLQYFFVQLRSGTAAGPATAPAATGLHRGALLAFPCGLVTAAQARAIAGSGFTARIQNHHRVALYARDPNDVRRALEADSALGSLAGGHNIASCPGTTWCAHGLINTHAVERLLREKLPQEFDSAIRISGCPNGCAHSGVGEIGLIGRVRKDEQGNRIEGVQMLAGGGMGRTPELARELEAFVPAGEAAERIMKISMPGGSTTNRHKHRCTLRTNQDQA